MVGCAGYSHGFGKQHHPIKLNKHMFPHTYFALFPPFPRENKVFVAMSFDDRFQSRWEKVIAPAIRNVVVNEISLEPHRVDARRIGDSILTEILGGITNDLLILADVTTLGYEGNQPIRNGNVMYEIGLAHAVRLPEEVLLFRSDTDRLLFDVANVRINSYDPDGNVDEARDKIADSIIESLKEIDLKRSLAIKAAAQSLDFKAWRILSLAAMKNGLQQFPNTLANAAANAAITRLLEVGALETGYVKITPDLLTALASFPEEKLVLYKPTPFGKAILGYTSNEILGKSVDIQSLIAALAEKEQPVEAVSHPDGSPQSMT